MRGMTNDLKKIISLSVITTLLIILALFLPIMITAFLPQVSITALANSKYTDKIFAAGKLEELSFSEISCTVPIVTDNVYVSVGDTVAIGDPIVSVNVPETKKAIAKLLSLTDYVSEETVSAIAQLDLDEDMINSAIPKVITADYGGTVSNLNISSGELAYPSETLATISDFGSIRARLNIPEEYAGELKVGQPVYLTISSTEKLYLATVEQIFPAAHDTMVGTSKETVLSCYASINEPSDEIKSGYTVSAEIAVGGEKVLASIPYLAINQDDNEQEFVYVLENGRAIKRDIKTGVEGTEMAEVVSGLTDTDIVIADCSKVKKDGGFVKVKQVPNA